MLPDAPAPGVVTPAPPARVDAMHAALVLAHIAVQLGEVDPDTVFRTAGDAHDGSTTTANLVAVIGCLAELLAAVFRQGATPAEAVAAFEHAIPILATQIAPPGGEAAQ